MTININDPPLSTRDGDNTGFNIDLSLLVVHVLGISSTLGSVNYITTNKYNRHNGLIMLSINIYNFSIVVTSILLIGSLPILGVGITGLLLDRNINSSIYDITGDPVLYQHLFLTKYIFIKIYLIIMLVFVLCSLMLTSYIYCVVTYYINLIHIFYYYY